jgi:iron complex outermembrane recepter protein
MNKNKLTAVIIAVLGSFASLLQAEDVKEEILVTANRVEQAADTLPLAWSSIGDQAIELTGHVHVNELMQRVPGAWISRGNGQESLPSLRSPVLTGAGSCGAFYMAADSISLRAPGFCNINQLFDANTEQAGRIEVIKGPGTASYGSNAMHGVINVLSQAPADDHNIALEAGPYDYYRARYRYSQTSGAHGFAVNLNGTSDGGYKDDSGYDQQKMTLRHDYAGATWDISSALDYSNLNQETAGFISGYEAYKDEDLKDTNPNPEAYRDARSLRLYSRASRAIGDSSTLVVTPYYRDNEMEFLMHFLPWQPVEENGHSSLGLQGALHTDFNAGHWSNGFELEYTDGWLKETQAEEFSPNQPAGVHYDYQVDAITAALFSQGNHRIGNALELTGGLRYEWTEYDYDNRTDDGAACEPTASACRFYRPADRTDDFGEFSFNLGASLEFLPDQIAFLRAARGFRAPQATELYRLQSGQEQADLDPEKLDNLELGLRGGSDAFNYSVSAYTMRKDDVIFQDANRYNVSGAKTRHEGIEASVDWLFAENWYLGAVASYARHRYDSRIKLLGSSGDIKGNDIDTAPRHLGSARLGWEFSSSGVAELEWIYLGSHYLEPDNQHKYDGHQLLNLRLASEFGQRWRATLRLTNLLDEDYAERADFGFGSYRYFVGQPLGAYLEIGYRLSP